ncbi:MAG: winged helix-turn-helix transcriptional regulator [Candidatus Pacebacteria bacterium]|nr:winged helix-turn-helix transcriptional regulator [Candidatus Paceibacterota bacterium]
MKIAEKQIKLLELYFKAVANKKRIKILMLINKNPNLSVEEISDILKINYQTGASHTQRLEKVGFIYKNYKGSVVEHKITDKGKHFLTFSEKVIN